MHLSSIENEQQNSFISSGKIIVETKAYRECVARGRIYATTMALAACGHTVTALNDDLECSKVEATADSSGHQSLFDALGCICIYWNTEELWF